jgi:WD40 repeat protein
VLLVDFAQPAKPLLRRALGPAHTVSCLAVSPAADTLYLGTLQGTCLRLELPSGKETWRIKVPQVMCLALSPDGTRLALGHDNAAPISWIDAASGVVLGKLPVAHEGQVDALAFSPDGLRLASAGADNCPLIWIVPR